MCIHHSPRKICRKECRLFFLELSRIRDVVDVSTQASELEENFIRTDVERFRILSMSATAWNMCDVKISAFEKICERDPSLVDQLRDQLRSFPILLGAEKEIKTSKAPSEPKSELPNTELSNTELGELSDATLNGLESELEKMKSEFERRGLPLPAGLEALSDLSVPLATDQRAMEDVMDGEESNEEESDSRQNSQDSGDSRTQLDVEQDSESDADSDDVLALVEKFSGTKGSDNTNVLGSDNTNAYSSAIVPVSFPQTLTEAKSLSHFDIISNTKKTSSAWRRELYGVERLRPVADRSDQKQRVLWRHRFCTSLA